MTTQKRFEMNLDVLRVVGEIAGIGGLALGVFLLLFRQLIQKSIFARLTKGQSHHLITLFMLLTFFVTLAGIAAWIYAQFLVSITPKGNAKPATAPPTIDQSERELSTLLNFRAERIVQAMENEERNQLATFQYKRDGRHCRSSRGEKAPACAVLRFLGHRRSLEL